MAATTRLAPGRASARALAAAAFYVGAQVALPAAADPLTDRFWVEGSAYFAGTDTSAFVSRPGQPGTVIDFEDDLEMDEHEVLPQITAGARVWDRVLIEGEFFRLDRHGERTIDRTIDFDGVTYPVGVDVQSDFTSNVYRLTIGYSFFRKPNWELGAAIGLHATQFDVGLEGMATIGGGTLQTETRKEDFLAPLPTVGLYGNWRIGKRWNVSARADYLSLSVGDYDGSVFNAEAAVSYQLTSAIAVGGAWRYVSYDLDVTRDDFVAGIDYDFSGTSLFLRVGFQ